MRSKTNGFFNVVKQALYGLHGGVKDDKMMLEIFNL